MNLLTPLPLFLLVALMLGRSSALWLGECNKPLGVSTGELPDRALTASSSHDHYVGPHRARLGEEGGGGAWCPKHAVDTRQGEWLEVDLGRPRLLTGVATQGRRAEGQGVEYTPAYTLSYWRPGMTSFTFYSAHPDAANKSLLVGNSDTYTEVKNSLARPLLASRVRLQPFSTHPRFVCLRLELFGCNYTEGLMNYSVGGVEGTYTWSVGAAAGEIMSVGEGVLFDGRAGVEEDATSALLPSTQDDPQLEGLVPAPDTPLPLTFTFDQMRRFNAIFLYLSTSNLNTKPKISVNVKFGTNTSSWDDVEVAWSWSSSELVPTGPHNLTLDLKNRPAKTLQVTLLVSSLEVNILELYFDSIPCHCRLGDWERRPVTSPEEHTAGRLPEPPADVWAVYTAHQHRTYVGVAVGFSVGVGILVLVWAGVWLRRRQGKASSPRVFRRPPPDTLDMKSLMEGVGLGVGLGGTITPTYEEGSCLLYDDIHQKSPLTSPHNTLTRGRPLTPDHTPVYATPTLRPSSTFPATSTFTSIPRPMTLAALPNPPPPIPPPPENFDRQIKVPAVTGAWLTCVYRQSPIQHGSPTNAPTPILAPQHITRTQLLASGAFATLSLGVVSENVEASLAEDGNLVTPPSSAALVTVTAHEAVPAAKRHAQMLATLQHENVASLMGVVLGGVGITMVMEYHPDAHLPEYLRARTLAPAHDPHGIDQSTVSVSWLVELAMQVASGMAFLESCNVTHTDLAARNVLVLGDVAKITQVGSALARYSGDYWRSPDGRGPAPLRWISPEALCQGAFSCSSDVWSYGVTLWEILTLARRPPHQHMSQDLLFHALLATHNQIQSHARPSSPQSDTYATPQLVLMAPTWCPREVQDIMTACWQPKPNLRPTFSTIQSILGNYLNAHK